MALPNNELEQITAYVSEHVKANLTAWLSDRSLGQPLALYEIEMRERIVRVEEELRHQRELMQQGFAQMEKRFELVDKQMEKRFELVDKRFEAVDKRFEEMREDMNRRFDAVDKHFDALTRRMDRFMIWSFGITITAAGMVISVLKLWP